MKRLLYLPLGVGLLLSSAIAQTRGSQTSDATIYAVAYIETGSSSREAALAALKQYRDASRREEGFVRIELFAQIGRPAHFVILEAWADQRTNDAHAMATAKKELLGKLEPIRVSDYDQRPYKPLSVGSVTASNDRTIYVLTHVDTSGPQAAVPASLQRLAEASRKETGNARFDVLQHTMKANHFTVIEAWQNSQAMDAHATAEHTKQYREALAPALGSPLDERLFQTVN